SVAGVGAVLIGQPAEGAVVVFLFAVGELLETVATGRARAGIAALTDLAPTTARLLNGERITDVPVEELRRGDTVQVRPGDRVPTDSTVLTGTAFIDESAVTGESVPVGKTVGDPLFGGSISTDALLTVRVERPASESTIAKIIHLVEEAEQN